MPDQTQGSLILHAMIDAGIKSVTDLADAVGVSRPSASGWVNDKIPVPSAAFARLGLVLMFDDAALGELARAAAAVAATNSNPNPQ
jgi:plasmid maintenance system antidote protein VapI